MKQEYFVVVLAHSLHGRLRRIQIPQSVIYAILALAALGCFSVFGFVSSYARMALKVANYNALRKEADGLRIRYERLQKVVSQTDQQMASLQMFASEVSVAYGIKQKLEKAPRIATEGRLMPTFAESVDEYNYLRSFQAPAFERSYARRFHVNVIPSIWPVLGRFESSFGKRTDPFSGEGAYHTGVDLQAPTGAPVHATADGIVIHAERFNGYGRLVVVDHGNGMQTYYAHLSRFRVFAGQEVRRGDIVGNVGSSGRVTAPHLHYEVRIGGAPINPHKYLDRPAPTKVVKRDLPF